MKKIASAALAMVLVFTCVFALAGCSKGTEKYDIVMITDGATITDGGYNQSAWNGVKSYADDKGVACRYYQPALNDEDALDDDVVLRYIDLAVKDGATTIVLPGECFAAPLCSVLDSAEGKYDDTHFILIGADIDAVSDADAAHSNVASVTFDALQAGYLAGYSSVALGNTRIGYFGSTDDASAQYGAGYVQGAARAADESATPVILDYANFDADDLDYDYSFRIEPIYTKISDCKEKVFKVNVVNGYGTGAYTDGQNVTITALPPEENKIFDHWEVKSDTDGVSDKKVNISSTKTESMNLLVGDCDCTITAVYADSETVPVVIEGGVTINAQKNSKVSVTAPAAMSGRVFDHWYCDQDVVADVNSSVTDVNVGEQAIQLTPVYADSDYPTFYVDVADGSGTGAYTTWDKVTITANPPQDGYMFYKWDNVDPQGKASGIAMDNEYAYSTTFEMVDRYAAVVEEMYDNGTQVIFAGGNPVADSIFTANGNFDYEIYVFGYGVDQKGKKNCLASVVNDYGAAVKLLLDDFKPGNMVGNCSNGCIYVTGMNTEQYYTDDEGNKKENDDYNAGYAKVYDAMTNGKIKVAAPADDPSSLSNAKCMTVNYWVKE